MKLPHKFSQWDNRDILEYWLVFIAVSVFVALLIFL